MNREDDEDSIVDQEVRYNTVEPQTKAHEDIKEDLKEHNSDDYEDDFEEASEVINFLRIFLEF